MAATLNVDDYVDLDSLRSIPKHPQFDRADLERPIPFPVLVPEPAKPELIRPEPPKGLGKLFGKGRYAKAVDAALSTHRLALEQWRVQTAEHLTLQQSAADKHALAEAKRVASLERERSRYAAECLRRDAEAVEHNKKIDELIANLGYGTVEAVQEYVAIVLSNSVYPEHFVVDHDFSFDPNTAELTLRVLVPGPTELPGIKAYKYTKSTDEITTTPLSQKDCKDRYGGAVHQVALRSLHEIFEADRRGIMNTVALEVGTETTHPATGVRAYIPFVAVAAERKQFLEFELSAVVPASTLAYLGAAVSKNPFGLVAVDTSGIRTS